MFFCGLRILTHDNSRHHSHHSHGPPFLDIGWIGVKHMVWRRRARRRTRRRLGRTRRRRKARWESGHGRMMTDANLLRGSRPCSLLRSLSLCHQDTNQSALCSWQPLLSTQPQLVSCGRGVGVLLQEGDPLGGRGGVGWQEVLGDSSERGLFWKVPL